MLLGKELELLAYRVRGLQQTFSQDMHIREGVILESEYNIHSFSDLDLALAEKPEIAFITNITSEHIPCAIKAARAGCHLFLEKPISHNTEGLKALGQLIREKQLIAFVGFQNRYHRGLTILRNILDNGSLGDLISIRLNMGEALATMHTYEDYKTTYMAVKNMGGGLILNQLIHELDYAQWIFGIPEGVYALNNINGNLSIDVEDQCDALFKIKRQGKIVALSIHGDFYQSPSTRTCEVIGENGRMLVDLITHKTTVCISGKFEQYHDPDFIRNDMFLEEVSDFLDCVKNNHKSPISYHSGLNSLRMAMAIKKSSTEGRYVKLDEITW